MEILQSTSDDETKTILFWQDNEKYVYLQRSGGDLEIIMRIGDDDVLRVEMTWIEFLGAMGYVEET